jgi:hypothetical protein
MANLFRLLGFSGNVSCAVKVDDDIMGASKFVTADLIRLPKDIITWAFPMQKSAMVSAEGRGETRVRRG